MQNNEAKSFFIRFLVLTLISILNVVLCYLIASNNTFTAVLTALLLMINVFFLLFYAVNSIGMFFKHTFDKNKEKTNYLYLGNMFLAVVVNVFYITFYFVLLGSSFITLIG